VLYYANGTLEDTFKRQPVKTACTQSMNVWTLLPSCLTIIHESQNSERFSGTHHPFNIHRTAISCARKVKAELQRCTTVLHQNNNLVHHVLVIIRYLYFL